MSLPAHALPDVWRAHELARSHAVGVDTGHAALNAVLPGGGWPAASLTELLQPRPGCGEWGLLAPALARVCDLGGSVTGGAGDRSHSAGAAGRHAVLVGAPHAPMGAALAARGLAPSHLVQVAARGAAQRLWVAEQALRCADVACVLLWLDQGQSAQLRRLHITAQEHAKLLFVLRPEWAQHESSPASLRLLLRWADDEADVVSASCLPPEADGPAPPSASATPPLWVRVLKRRGPPLESPLLLFTASPGLQALLAASRAQAQARVRGRRGLAVLPALNVHAVDRVAGLV